MRNFLLEFVILQPSLSFQLLTSSKCSNNSSIRRSSKITKRRSENWSTTLRITGLDDQLVEVEEVHPFFRSHSGTFTIRLSMICLAQTTQWKDGIVDFRSYLVPTTQQSGNSSMVLRRNKAWTRWNWSNFWLADNLHHQRRNIEKRLNASRRSFLNMGTAQMSTISVELRTTLVYKCNYKLNCL